MERSSRGLLWALSRNFPGGIKKNTINLSHYIRSLGRDWNPGPSEYEEG
jgi:hypothetical protein